MNAECEGIKTEINLKVDNDRRLISQRLYAIDREKLVVGSVRDLPLVAKA